MIRVVVRLDGRAAGRPWSLVRQRHGGRPQPGPPRCVVVVLATSPQDVGNAPAAFGKWFQRSGFAGGPGLEGLSTGRPADDQQFTHRHGVLYPDQPKQLQAARVPLSGAGKEEVRGGAAGRGLGGGELRRLLGGQGEHGSPHACQSTTRIGQGLADLRDITGGTIPGAITIVCAATIRQRQ